MADRRRAVLIGAGLLLAAVLAAAAIVAVTGDDDPDTTLSAEETSTTTVATSTTSTAPEETTTTEATSSTTTAASVTPTRRQLAADPAGAWKLFMVEPPHCLELEAGGATTKDLLCDAQATTSPVGALVTVPAAPNRVLVAVVQSKVTGMSSMPHRGGGYFHDAVTAKDPTRAGVQYLAGVVSPTDMSLIVRAGAHTIARVDVPAQNRTYAAGELRQVIGRPYGEWPGYRKGASTGLFHGGDQEVGFYDGDGTTCVLYRRIGGPSEGMLGEGCPLADSADHLAVAELGLTPTPNRFVVLGLTDLQGVRLRIDVPDGTTRTAGTTRVADPSGSAWAALVDSTADIEVPDGTRQVVFVLVDDRGTERARRTVQVPVASS